MPMQNEYVKIETESKILIRRMSCQKVVIIQPNWDILSKFGVQVDFEIRKRVPRCRRYNRIQK